VRSGQAFTVFYDLFARALTLPLYASCVSPDPNSSGFRGLGAKAAFEAEAIGL
jgi:hypothetical protein